MAMCHLNQKYLHTEEIWPFLLALSSLLHSWLTSIQGFLDGSITGEFYRFCFYCDGTFGLFDDLSFFVLPLT